MLTSIHIKNFTLIEQSEIALHQGLTTVTGETGAGKSLLLDAIQLGLGARADLQTIRPGYERAELTLTFDISQSQPVQQWLQEHDFEVSNDCYVTRILSKQGTSKCLINARPCPLQQLKELTGFLVSLHGQHQHQQLLKSSQQRDLLDEFADHATLIQQVNKAYQKWLQANDAVKQLQEKISEKDAKDELLHYQVDELDQLNLVDNEFELLDKAHKKLTNADSLQQEIQRSLVIIRDDDKAILSQLSTLIHNISAIKSSTDDTQNILTLLNDAMVSLEEVSQELTHLGDGIEHDEERLYEIEARLSLLFNLARKHQVSPQELPALYQQLSQDLKDLTAIDQALQKAQQHLAETERQFFNEAEKLSQSRKKAAVTLGKQVTKLMPDLGMTGGQFTISIEATEQTKPARHGIDNVQFLVNCNIGQAQGPLAKIASGGELSRLALAIYVSCAKSTTVPCLIFDEVDVGIGGSIADVVGRLLKRLAKNTQILCITHLPQVAAYGDYHLHVKKQSDADKTTSQAHYLNDEARITEMARMLGGQTITSNTIAHAKEMLTQIIDA